MISRYAGDTVPATFRDPGKIKLSVLMCHRWNSDRPEVVSVLNSMCLGLLCGLVFRGSCMASRSVRTKIKGELNRSLVGPWSSLLRLKCGRRRAFYWV